MILSQGDVAIVQHEYGIFGGADGDEVLDLLNASTCRQSSYSTPCRHSRAFTSAPYLLRSVRSPIGWW